MADERAFSRQIRSGSARPVRRAHPRGHGRGAITRDGARLQQLSRWRDDVCAKGEVEALISTLAAMGELCNYCARHTDCSWFLTDGTSRDNIKTSNGADFPGTKGGLSCRIIFSSGDTRTHPSKP